MESLCELTKDLHIVEHLNNVWSTAIRIFGSRCNSVP
jgi:hypothetical protein